LGEEAHTYTIDVDLNHSAHPLIRNPAGSYVQYTSVGEEKRVGLCAGECR
jgi:hypothetical protein